MVRVVKSTHFALKNFGLDVICATNGTVVHVKVLSVNPRLINISVKNVLHNTT